MSARRIAGQAHSADCCSAGIDGSAAPAIEGDNLDVVQPKTPPAQQVSVPSMEKGDEPLSQHKEEAADELSKQGGALDDGLSLLQKLGMVSVIVALCAWFLGTRSRKSTTAGRHGAYEKSMA